MQNFLRTALVLLGVVIAYLMFTLIQSMERMHRSNRQVLAKLEEISRNNNQGVSLRPQAVAASADAEKPAFSAAIANREFFVSAAPVGGKLVSVLSADPPGFNPLTSNEASSRAIYELCSTTLAERNWQHPERFEPLLALSFEVGADKKSYRVKLRKDVFWQSFTDPDSGKYVPPASVTAHDVKFTVDVIKNMDVNCASLRPYYMDLSKVEVVNDHELLFYWDKEYYGSLAATLELFPLPRHFYMQNGRFDPKKFNNDHKRNRMIVGCGPYIFVKWDKARRIVLRRNPGYFGRNYGIAPAIEERIFEIIKHPNTQFQALTGGKVDMLALSPEQWTRRSSIPEFTRGTLKRHRYPGSGYTYIGYNQQNHCFADKLTRQALTMLIDRERLLKELLYGCGKVVNGPFAPDSVYADAKLKPFPYDPARAKELLKKAGWHDSNGDGILERNGKRFEFTMLQISGSSMQARMLPMIKEFFAAAGIDMKLQTVEWSVYIERLKSRNFDACNLGWTGSIDPDPYQIFHSSQISAGDNFVGLKNLELDRAIEALRREFDIDKRIELCRKIELLLYDEQPYTFMFCPDALVALRSDYKNVRLFPYGLRAIAFYL